MLFNREIPTWSEEEETERLSRCAFTPLKGLEFRENPRVRLMISFGNGAVKFLAVLLAGVKGEPTNFN